MEERTFFQKVVLAILLAMMVVFGAVTAFNQTQKGILFRDKFLRLEEVTDADCFTGKVEGEKVTILRWYDSGEKNTTKITLRVGERIQDTYTVYLGEPMIPLKGTVATITSTLLEVPTLRVTKNETLIYEGGYQASSGMFYTTDGEWTAVGLDITIHTSGVHPWENYTMPERFLVQLALEPELEDRGDWRLYGVMVFFTLLMMVDVAFPYTLFRWRHRRWVKNPEPTEDYMSVQHLVWMIALPVLLILYIWTSTTLMDVV